jgi:hypothetical protein
VKLEVDEIYTDFFLDSILVCPTIPHRWGIEDENLRKIKTVISGSTRSYDNPKKVMWSL